MVDEECKNCFLKHKNKVKKFRLEFVTELVNEAMGEVLPDDDNTSGTFCVMPDCDPQFRLLME